MSELQYSIDYFIQKDAILFSYGWIFNRNNVIQKVTLMITDEEYYPAVIHVDYGKYRADLKNHSSNNNNMLYSGYMIYAASNKLTAPKKKLLLCCSYIDGNKEYIDITHKLMVVSQDNSHPLNAHTLNQFVIFAKRAITLLLKGKWSSLYKKTTHHLKNITLAHLKSADEINNILTKKERNKIIFLLDHNLGGGANHYRDQLIAKKLKLGFTAFVLYFNITSLSYQLLIRKRTHDVVYKIDDLTFIYTLLAHVKIEEIIYNTAVSFIKAEQIPFFLIELKIKTHAKLIVLAHDFFPLCPSHFLIDYLGKYCDLPNVDYCKTCLTNNTFGFTALFELGDINEWRRRWEGLLMLADQFITFSHNTLSLYQRVFHKLEPQKCQVIPHTIPYITKKAQITQKKKLCLGVVGQIGYHKGADVVKQLAQEIKKQQLPIEIIIIGTIETDCPASIVKQTGPYKQTELPSLLEKHGVNLILFPSIWPETFSYVVQEIIELGYPIASFNLGAPAERIQNYQYGLLLSSFEPLHILQELIHFGQKIYAFN